MKKTLGLLLAMIWCSFWFGAAQSKTVFDAATIETWADEYFTKALESRRMNGASVGFIQDGEIIFMKGYGWADEGEGIPIDPTKTRFRMCSTSKTVTATVLMQLVERGQISSLDDPVNQYLTRYQVPPPYGDDVTFRQLMTHSSGMAGHFTPQGTKKNLPVPVDADRVERFFKENIERVPGSIGQYANLGVALEGVAIEDITGQPLATYVAENIFEPLGMTSALFHHSLEEPPYLAQPYGIYPDGSLQKVPFYPKHPLTAASGGFIVTTEDMLAYVALHADDEGSNHQDILSGGGRQALHRRHFAHHPADPGMGLHFYRDNYGGEQMVSHGCGLPGTSSLMGVFPDSHAGFIVTVLKSDAVPSVGDYFAKLLGRGPLVEGPEGPKGDSVKTREIAKALLGDVVLPDPTGMPIADDVVTDLSLLPGTYWGERRSMTSFATLFGAGDVTKVSAGVNDGEIMVGDDVYRQVAPGVYDLTEKARRIIFRQPQPGGPIYMHRSPSASMKQTKGLGNPQHASGLLALSVLGGLTGLLALVWGRWSGLEGTTRWMAVGMAASVIAIPVLLFTGYDTMGDIAFIDVTNGDLGRAMMVLAAINVFFLLGIGLVAMMVTAWAKGLYGGGIRGLAIKAHLTLLAAAAIASWPAMLLFNLIGFQT